jgi:hypothetical protein
MKSPQTNQWPSAANATLHAVALPHLEQELAAKLSPRDPSTPPWSSLSVTQSSKMQALPIAQ